MLFISFWGNSQTIFEQYADSLVNLVKQFSEIGEYASDLASAASALASETATAALYDNFDDRYLGPKASAPATDNDGAPLLTGAL